VTDNPSLDRAGTEGPGGAARSERWPTRDSRPGLSGLADGALEAWLAGRREPRYRAVQVREAIWRGHAVSSDELTTLPAPLRADLERDFRVDSITDEVVTVADRGLTEKALHRLSDGALVESVLMHYPARRRSGESGESGGSRRERYTLCISSQAGCAVGCPFCATGELGFGRDLETAEILDQVRHAARRLAASDSTEAHLTNVVFMGMGEPLLNLDRVLEAVAALSDPGRFGLGARHVVISTSGVVPGIRRLTELNPQLTLAISLHAARDALRDLLVPLNLRWPIAEVLAAARDHARRTGRRVSFEYVMISGVNDTDADADALTGLLRGDLAHVNLIPMNPVAHTPWRASSAERTRTFAERLLRGGVGATVRANRGVDAGAACGQLAANRAGEPSAASVARRREVILERGAAALRGERGSGLAAELDATLSRSRRPAGEHR